MLEDGFFSFIFPPIILNSHNHAMEINTYKWTMMGFARHASQEVGDQWVVGHWELRSPSRSHVWERHRPCSLEFRVGNLLWQGHWIIHEKPKIGWRMGTTEAFSSTPVPIHRAPPLCRWMKRMNAPPASPRSLQVPTRGTTSFPISRSPRFLWTRRMPWMERMICGWMRDVGDASYLNNEYL